MNPVDSKVRKMPIQFSMLVIEKELAQIYEVIAEREIQRKRERERNKERDKG